jgi:uncharacterized protein
MKSIDIETIEKLPGRQLGPKDNFNFRCHPDIECFNLCCRNLNLFLYPYDVVRLKNCLEMDSDQFLEQHVHVVLREGNFFPDVLLAMQENEEKTCPFLTKEGCTVYVDRPDTCRTFPLEQGSLYDADKNKAELIHFFRPPDFCQGQHEKKIWTIDGWQKDQDAATYHRMTASWAELKRLFINDPWAGQGPDGPRAKMAFMATYNIDRFREFVFESSFLKRYKVTAPILKKARKDDTALLKIGFAWVKLFLWGQAGKTIKPKR